MMLLLDLPVATDWLLAIAALLTAIVGAISTIVGMKRARREERDKAEEECLRRLREARKEAEEAADELHKIRMRREHEG